MSLLYLLLQLTLLPYLTMGFLFGSDSEGEFPKCSPGQYRSPALTSRQCLPCSLCPRNHIVRQPCTVNQDTVCGPFHEFDSFIQENEEQSVGQGNGVQDSEQMGGIKDDEALTHVQYNGPSLHSDVQHWKELCYGLIGALVLVIMLSALCIIVLYKRATRSGAKMITVQPDVADPQIYYDTHQLPVSQPHNNTGAPASGTPLLPNGQPGITITVPSSVVHLEAQVQRNTQSRSLLSRVWRPYSGHSRRHHSWSHENEYVDGEYQVLRMPASRPVLPLAAITDIEAGDTDAVVDNTDAMASPIAIQTVSVMGSEDVVVVS